MNSANGEKTIDLKSDLVDHSTISSFNEKQSVKAEKDRKPDKMSKLQHCIFTVLLLCLLTSGIVSATLNNKPQDAAAPLSQEQIRFQELLNTVDPSALHEALHENVKDKYQHGVFQEDKAAVEAIHQQNAEAAESLIELAKRQATGSGNSTVVTSTAVTTTDTVVTSTDSITTTPSSTPATTPSESQSSTPPASTPQSTSTPASSAQSTAVVSSTVTQVSTSSAGGSTSERASSSEPTPVSTSTPTSKASTSSPPSKSEAETKTTPSSSRTTIYTTTLANGALTTFTSVTVVPAGQADQTTGGSPATTSSGSSASLQTGGSTKAEVALSAMLGALGIAFMGAL